MEKELLTQIVSVHLLDIYVQKAPSQVENVIKAAAPLKQPCKYDALLCDSCNFLFLCEGVE